MCLMGSVSVLSFIQPSSNPIQSLKSDLQDRFVTPFFSVEVSCFSLKYENQEQMSCLQAFLFDWSSAIGVFPWVLLRN